MFQFFFCGKSSVELWKQYLQVKAYDVLFWVCVLSIVSFLNVGFKMFALTKVQSKSWEAMQPRIRGLRMILLNYLYTIVFIKICDIL